MNPRTARFWAIVVCILLTLFDFVWPVLSIVIAGLVLLCGLGLWIRYVRLRRKASAALLPTAPERPPNGECDALGEQRRRPSRNASDRLVFGSIFLATVLPTLVGTAVVVHGAPSLAVLPHAERLPFVAVPAVSIAVLFYVPNLIDWYYVLPRVSGVIRLPPCRSTMDRRWITVSRFWLTNRWLSIVLGPILAGTFQIAGFVFYFIAFTNIDVKDQVALSFNSFGAVLLIAGITVGINFKLLDRLNEMLNPIKVVGKLVRYRDGLYYIVDVSTQGIKILQVADTGRYAGEPFPNHKGRLVDPKEVEIREPEYPFRGCERSCSGVNWYCDNNWRLERYR